jgi:hypothetical protein
MNTLKKYKKEVRNLFFISIDKDIEKWEEYSDYYSPRYNNNSRLRINKRNDPFEYLEIEINSYDKKICAFKWFFIPLDFKVYLYVKKLSRHFKNIKKDKQNANDINFLKSGIENIRKNFIKEVRNEKLKKIEKIMK